MTVDYCGRDHQYSTSAPVMPGRKKTTAGNGIPCVDLSSNNSADLIVKACQQFGFFKVVNHGVPTHAVSCLEKESTHFFQKPRREKHRAGPPNPFGYGCKNIGHNGDRGELEYLLMEANPASVNHRSAALSPDRSPHLSSAVNDYVAAARSLACRLLDLAEEGLSGAATLHHFSHLIAHPDNDSCFRINRYPPTPDVDDDDEDIEGIEGDREGRVGFGEHSDPQILTILRSNEVAGLEIWSPEGRWIPVIPEPEQMFVLVGDAFEALTNGRFRSVRHRVVANSGKPRTSMMYFGAPPLNAWVRPHPDLLSAHHSPRLYRDFTWGHFKTAVYASRLADHRLHLFTM